MNIGNILERINERNDINKNSKAFIKICGYLCKDVKQIPIVDIVEMSVERKYIPNIYCTNSIVETICFVYDTSKNIQKCLTINDVINKFNNLDKNIYVCGIEKDTKYKLVSSVLECQKN